MQSLAAGGGGDVPYGGTQLAAQSVPAAFAL